MADKKKKTPAKAPAKKAPAKKAPAKKTAPKKEAAKKKPAAVKPAPKKAEEPKALVGVVAPPAPVEREVVKITTPAPAVTGEKISPTPAPKKRGFFARLLGRR